MISTSCRFALSGCMAAVSFMTAGVAESQKVQTRSGLADCAADSATPILAPTTPLPSEAATAGITRFSFVAYGDPRGRHDGTQIQPDHLMVVESILATAQQLSNTPDAIRFVVQSGD